MIGDDISTITVKQSSGKEQALQRKKVKQYYNDMDSEFALMRTLIQAGQKAHKSQAEVVALMGTSASVVGRLETGGGKQKHFPALATLGCYAKAVNQKLVVKLVPCDR